MIPGNVYNYGEAMPEILTEATPHAPTARKGVLREEMEVANEIVVLDGLLLQDFDYVDLGKIRVPSMTVPVTIKSLLFREDPRAEEDVPHLAQHHHHGHEQR